MDEQALSGGNMGGAVRVRSTVRKPVATAAPKPLRLDAIGGRESAAASERLDLGY